MCFPLDPLNCFRVKFPMRSKLTVCHKGFSSPSNAVNLGSLNLWAYLPSFSSTRSSFRHRVHLLVKVLNILLIPSAVEQVIPVFHLTIVNPRGRCNPLRLEVSMWYNLKILVFDIQRKIFFLYKFYKSFVYFGGKWRSGASTSQMTTEMIFMFLESVEQGEWDKIR